MRRSGGTRTVVLVLLLLLNPLPCSSSFPFLFSNYRTLFSLSHSLFTRVANLRDSRGDFHGASRARSIAAKLDSALGIGFWKVMWDLAWDYARNYFFMSTPSDMLGALSDLNEILSALTELSRVSSDRERLNYYHNVLRISKSLLARFRKLFPQSGPLKEVIETLQKEVVEGDLIKDCLELGTSDLKGLITVLKDISSKYTSASSTRADL